MTLSNLSVSNITQNSAYASWNNDIAEDVNISVTNPSHINTFSKFDCNIINMNPNTTYSITVTGQSTGQQISTSFTTLAAPTHLSLNSATNTSLNIHAASNYYGANTFDWYLNNVYQTTTTGTNDGTGYYYSDYTFTGLSAGTSYTIGVHVFLNGSDVEQGSGAFSTTSSRPALFDWQYSKNSGNTLTVSAQELNSLATNINNVRSYKNFAAYSFPNISIGGTANSLSLWTDFHDAINAMSPPTPMNQPTTSTNFSDSAFWANVKSSINSIS